MALTPSLPTGSPAGLPLIARRRIQAGLVARAADGTPRTGVLPASFGPLVTGKASMGYNIAEFVAVTSRQSPGVEFVANDGTVDLSPTGYAAPTANSRLDVIWVRSRFTGFGDSSDAPEFGITQGAASPTPVKPSLPAGALELAVAEVKATDTTTQTVVITQTHRYTAMAGGVVPVRNEADLNSWNPADGAESYRIDARVGYERVSGSWVRRQLFKGSRISASTNDDGIVIVPNPFSPMVPTSVQLTLQNGQLATDDLARILSPMVWTSPLTGGDVLIRFRRTDTNQWAARQPVVFFITFGIS